MSREEERLKESRDREKHWKRWGPYLSERQWGTVREDYSAYGSAWDFFPHDHARSKAYRWGEDGLAGISDRHQQICFALALWNGRDPILKERLFGLTGNEGNHGEDVKEYYFYVDSTPTHSYMKHLYKYPQSEFPYARLIEANKKNGKRDLEFELIGTGVFKENRYFDATTEYAKAAPEDLLIQITLTNHGPEPAEIHVLPTVWFRNTWSWNGGSKPELHELDAQTIELNHHMYGKRYLYAENSGELLFTENETNTQRFYGSKNGTAYAKDGINDYIVHSRKDAVNPEQKGTKASAHYVKTIPGKESMTFRLRFTNEELGKPFDSSFEKLFSGRKKEADEFYDSVIPSELSTDAKSVMRQAFAGMLWSKQYYGYEVDRWLKGDPAQPEPPKERLNGRNHEWNHLFNDDVISMPDKWEYPWYAAWDLAFHCIPLALIDPDFAKEQLLLFTREWYMHPNGQLPAYEWAFSDVNPPVHAWAAWRVYKIDKKRNGKGDQTFLKRIFQKLMLNFTWWVNRKDADGRNIFQGGFLGLDNIGVFDRSKPLPTGGHIAQSDGTSWMAMYCLNLLAIALELAKEDTAFEDVASKFWEHFVFIARAMNHRGGNELSLWDEADGFFYDVLHLSDGNFFPMKVRSMVGLIPLFAVETLEPEMLQELPAFKKRLEWFIDHRPDLTKNLACMRTTGMQERRLLSIVNGESLRRILKIMLDENEFFSPYGIRALSRFHKDHPYILHVNGEEHRVDYEPAESSTGLFGGNSNWRGPIWFPVNFLLVESLQKFHRYLGDDFKVECPTGSGQMMTLWEVAGEISKRLTRIFLKDDAGRRPVFGGTQLFQQQQDWNSYIPFHEYFHGDNGAGIGASHQTGWTGLVAKLLQQSGE